MYFKLRFIDLAIEKKPDYNNWHPQCQIFENKDLSVESQLFGKTNQGRVKNLMGPEL